MVTNCSQHILMSSLSEPCFARPPTTRAPGSKDARGSSILSVMAAPSSPNPPETIASRASMAVSGGAPKAFIMAEAAKHSPRAPALTLAAFRISGMSTSRGCSAMGFCAFWETDAPHLDQSMGMSRRALIVANSRVPSFALSSAGALLATAARASFFSCVISAFAHSKPTSAFRIAMSLSTGVRAPLEERARTAATSLRCDKMNFSAVAWALPLLSSSGASLSISSVRA
mmetsp:Transcript_21844/g.65658  ORF Transcript_21844/g.65658 Transcript_21844/m.65658 type:complete len:229 (+) Transcript_21844:978-1664(+)